MLGGPIGTEEYILCLESLALNLRDSRNSSQLTAIRLAVVDINDLLAGDGVIKIVGAIDRGFYRTFDPTMLS
jgi:hypothetical protein